MAAVHFRAKKVKGDLIQIYLDYTFRKGDRLRFFTGYTTTDANWDYKKERFKSKTTSNKSDINIQLNLLEKEALNINNAYQASNELLTQEIFKQKLTAFINRDKEQKNQAGNLFMNFFEHIINERAANRRYTDGSIKVYRTTYRKLIDYQATLKQPVDFKDLCHDFFIAFEQFIADQKYKTNYIGKITSTLKTILKEADKREVVSGFRYVPGWIKVPSEEVISIHLTEAEIEKIIQLDLSNNPRLCSVRDQFVLGCYTGLRFSDFRMIRPEYIYESKGRVYLKMTTQKTSQIVNIPLKQVVVNILTKYGYRMRAISNQKFNEYIKEIGKLAEIDSVVVKTDKINGKKHEKTYFKYELITTHTARRSFATNAYAAGLDIKNIMSITGHRTEVQFRKYIKTTSEELAEQSAQHQFFE